MKYTFKLIFVILYHILILPLCVLLIFLSFWYWDGKFIDIEDKLSNIFKQFLSEK